MTTYQELLGDRIEESIASEDYLNCRIDYVTVPSSSLLIEWDFEAKFSDGTDDLFDYPKAELLQRCLALGIPFLANRTDMEEK